MQPSVPGSDDSKTVIESVNLTTNFVIAARTKFPYSHIRIAWRPANVALSHTSHEGQVVLQTHMNSIFGSHERGGQLKPNSDHVHFIRYQPHRCSTCF